MDTNVTQPKISVCVCTFNRASMLSQAIDSIIFQTYRNLEIIVIDDGSTDTTQKIMDEYTRRDVRIVYMRNTVNIGINATRNIALEHCTGEYIAVLDSDDYWIMPDKLALQMQFLSTNPDVSIVGTGAQAVDAQGRATGTIEAPTHNLSENILLKNPLTHSSVLYKKSSFPRGYETRFMIWEDYATWLSLNPAEKIANIPTITTAYRIHGGNISARKKIRNVATLQKVIWYYRHKHPHWILATLKNILRVFI
jgi:glycosyltransferase involved in cell wall biosynthesis